MKTRINLSAYTIIALLSIVWILINLAMEAGNLQPAYIIDWRHLIGFVAIAATYFWIGWLAGRDSKQEQEDE